MKVETLPWAQLPPSVRVDVLQLSANAKPAIRVLSATTAVDLREDLRGWAIANDLGAASDDEYTCIARDYLSAADSLRVDSMGRAHELEFGLALGYPTCCCEAIRRIGESAIDERAQEIKTWTFHGQYTIINPERYSLGGALISHLPCTPTCEASLRLASSAVDWIQRQTRLVCVELEPWTTWTETLRKLDR